MTQMGFISLVLVLLTGCGAEPPAPSEGPIEPEAPPVCALATNQATGDTESVPAELAIRMIWTASTSSGAWSLLGFEISSKRSPGCQRVRLESLPFTLQGSRRPSLDYWAMYSETYQEEGTFGGGEIAGDEIIFDASAISIGPGETKTLVMAVHNSGSLPGQVFTLVLSGPLVWKTPDSDTLFTTTEGLPLSGSFTF